MRTLCDVCESAGAILFCAADEAALCRACDDKVHMCNKLASRHVRVGLDEPSEVPRCDICENAPAFFYCGVDGSSLCLQCDMIVHVGGKRTHERYLLLRQKVKFPEDKPGSIDNLELQRLISLGEANKERADTASLVVKENRQNHWVSADNVQGNNVDGYGKQESEMIDLNARPQRTHGVAPTPQEQAGTLVGNSHESASLVPDGYFKMEPEM